MKSIVTSLDYTKAFDSIDRGKMIKTMMDYRIHPKIIESVAKIYEGDNTKMKLNEEMEALMNISSGIKQGCTGSTTLFKLMTYKIMKQMEELNAGYEDGKFKFTTLYFADDSLLLAKDIEAAANNIKMISEISHNVIYIYK